jgi:hypothetical protein
MSGRETTVNVLLGLILLLIFALPVVATVVVFGYLVLAISLPPTHYLSSLGLPRQDTGFYCLLCLIAIASGVRYLRKRFWSNALLSFAVIAMGAARWYGAAGGQPDSAFSQAWPLMVLGLIPANRSLRRWECAVGGIILSTGIVLSAGLLGAGTAAHLVADFSYFCAFVWMAVQFRSRQNEQQRPHALLPPHSLA